MKTNPKVGFLNHFLSVAAFFSLIFCCDNFFTKIEIFWVFQNSCKLLDHSKFDANSLMKWSEYYIFFKLFSLLCISIHLTSKFFLWPIWIVCAATSNHNNNNNDSDGKNTVHCIYQFKLCWKQNDKKYNNCREWGREHRVKMETSTNRFVWGKKDR